MRTHNALAKLTALSTIVAVALLAGTANATVYTFNGSADGNYFNDDNDGNGDGNNWLNNGVAAGANDAGIDPGGNHTLIFDAGGNPGASIILDGANECYIFNGGNSTLHLQVLSGSVTDSSNNMGNKWDFAGNSSAIVGGGASAAALNLNFNVYNYGNRTWDIGDNGTLAVSGAFDMKSNAVAITIDAGTMIAGSLSNYGSGSVLLGLDGSMTVNSNSGFANIGAVEASSLWSATGSATGLQFADNGMGTNGGFTVTGASATAGQIPEPATIAVWSLLGLCWAGVRVWRRRRNALAESNARPFRRRWPEANRNAIRQMLDRQLVK